MRKKHVSSQDQSLKTALMYTGVVVLFILVSLAIKGFLVVKASKFDGKHHFTLVIAKEGNTEQVIAFSPDKASLSLLKIQGNDLPVASLGKSLGVVADGKIEGKENLPIGEDVSQTLLSAMLRYASIKTDMTIVDIVRLFLLTKEVQAGDMLVKELSVSKEDPDGDEILASFFADDALASENVTIQIINATEIPGMGKRLERVLSNMGANVVQVSSSAKKEPVSQIRYFGKESYVLQKLQKTLHFPVSVLDKQSVANIVIVIGDDSEKTTRF